MATVLATDSITITFSPSAVITWLIIGAIAGALAGALMRGYSLGLVGNIILGLIGALVGGFLFTLLRISLPSFFNASITITLADVVIAFIGAIIVLLIVGAIYHRRRV